MSKNNRKHNNNHRPELPESVIIDLKGRNVGKEDFETAALRLKFAEHEGFRGTDLMQASAVAQGLEVANGLAAQGKHAEAAKQAYSCLWVLNKNRTVAKNQNRKALGMIEFECRDGLIRKIGNVVEWYIGTHSRIAEQISVAKSDEELEAMQAEIEALEAAEALKQGHLVGSMTAEVKAA